MSETQTQFTRRSRLFTRGPIDGRGREGRFLGRVRQELISDLGGSPSGAERMLIDRVAGMMLRLALFDERMARATRCPATSTAHTRA